MGSCHLSPLKAYKHPFLRLGLQSCILFTLEGKRTLATNLRQYYTPLVLRFKDRVIMMDDC